MRTVNPVIKVHMQRKNRASEKLRENFTVLNTNGYPRACSEGAGGFHPRPLRGVGGRNCSARCIFPKNERKYRGLQNANFLMRRPPPFSAPLELNAIQALVGIQFYTSTFLQMIGLQGK